MSYSVTGVAELVTIRSRPSFWLDGLDRDDERAYSGLHAYVVEGEVQILVHSRVGSR
jgi:hypothetical protein